ncbi:hypothetical protein B0T21DRAFT_416405 [Apiosordaria backusii]|uniref:Uncharacterized protein n=1 Tax=Apiosordaria backusii TaxID=314023 RepID=A0AA40A0T6_9PEZI|nr:hypothetical protein B0T21DRAFT_416405 [Apiosordaria backusii]
MSNAKSRHLDSAQDIQHNGRGEKISNSAAAGNTVPEQRRSGGQRVYPSFRDTHGPSAKEDEESLNQNKSSPELEQDFYAQPSAVPSDVSDATLQANIAVTGGQAGGKFTVSVTVGLPQNRGESSSSSSSYPPFASASTGRKRSGGNHEKPLVVGGTPPYRPPLSSTTIVDTHRVSESKITQTSRMTEVTAERRVDSNVDREMNTTTGTRSTVPTTPTEMGAEPGRSTTHMQAATTSRQSSRRLTDHDKTGVYEGGTTRKGNNLSVADPVPSMLVASGSPEPDRDPSAGGVQVELSPDVAQHRSGNYSRPPRASLRPQQINPLPTSDPRQKQTNPLPTSDNVIDIGPKARKKGGCC